MEEPKRALIIGINGQVGTHLKDFLLSKGYIVHGLIRFSSSNKRLLHSTSEDECVVYHHGDLADSVSLIGIISSIKPHEVYNVGSVSNAQISFKLAEYVQRVDGMGTLRILQALRACSLDHFTRVYQAGSSELFGKAQESPQNEHTPFHPRSPYGVSKQFSYWTIVNHREAHGMHVSNGIVFNSESPLRSAEFVTRKITSTVARIKRGLQACLEIGNLDACRDWSHVRDFVRGMWMMLQQDEGGDYILCSGVARPVREFVSEAFGVVGIEIEWEGQRGSVDEKGVDRASGRVVVAVNPAYFRTVEDFPLRGDASKAERVLGWQTKVSFGELVREMVEADLAVIDRRIQMEGDDSNVINTT